MLGLCRMRHCVDTRLPQTYHIESVTTLTLAS